MHPVEFVLGEYNHLLALYITGLLLQARSPLRAQNQNLLRSSHAQRPRCQPHAAHSPGARCRRTPAIGRTRAAPTLLRRAAAGLLGGATPQEVHIAAALAFLVAGGIMASLNHTRFDVRVPPGVYDVRVHDVHHRMPKSNYGQYIMLWDRVRAPQNLRRPAKFTPRPQHPAWPPTLRHHPRELSFAASLPRLSVRLLATLSCPQSCSSHQHQAHHTST